MMTKNISLIKNYLDELYEKPWCELNYTKDYELLIAIMLSAKTTDKAVNKVTNILFQKYDTLEKLANSNLDDLKQIIKPLGTYNQKSLNILVISQSLINDYQGIVPKTHQELEKMRGVGRKTANVLLSLLYNIPEFAVDTHIIRISNRLQLVKTTNPLEVELSLKKYFPKEEWIKRHQQLVLFGRYHCKALKPDCSNCKLQKICKKFNS